MPAPKTPTTSAAVGGGMARLPWWSLALPVVAFACLLGLLAEPARAGTSPEGSAVRFVVEYLHALLTR
ncbi:hypothetical protein ABT354_25110 [Streptomyces sp. NPDC000594]|uniref:hypothetical protein n=1 Tax=Streptomyces sp. NPDC000594 TaxID=3154261 RepID=UPI00331EA11A